MANEFKHKDPGAELTSAEYIASSGCGHIFACQATGDIAYASSATVLSKLGKGAAGTILNMGGSCIPAWTATPTIGSTSWCNAGHAHAASNSGGTVCANVLAGTTLKSCVVTSSLTSVGTLGALTVDDVAINGKVVTMTGSACDTIVMTAATNGAFSLVTTDTAAAAANIVITADGTVDVNSAGLLTLDSGAAINIEPAACSAILLDGTISIDAGVVTGATSITSTAFVGTIDGVVGGNTPAAITGTTLSVDNFTLNGTELDLSSGDFALDVAGDVEINADGGCINFKDASLALAAIVNTSCVGELRIHEAANYVGFKAPALSGNQTWTLPAAVACCACDVLTCNGSGVLSWATAGGGAVSAVANGSNNRVSTFSSSTALNGEANLTFTGSLLTLAGNLELTTTDGATKFIRTISCTTGLIAPFVITPTSTGNAADTFGSAIQFNIADCGVGATRLGVFGIARNGADNSGKYIFNVDNAGTQGTEMTICSSSVSLENNTLLNVGASGNDWCTRTLTHSGDSGGNATILLQNPSTASGRKAFLRMVVQSSAGAAADPEISFETCGGTSWQVGIDNSNSDIFTIGNTGDIGYADAMRITTGEVTTFQCQGADFDWWCPECGYASGIYRSHCPRCQAGLEWHCDNLPMKQLSSIETRVKAEQHLSRLGVLELSCNEDGTPWRGMNIVNGIRYSWGMARQNHDQINRDYECVNERLKRLEAQVWR
jgi:hypothetical protein